MRPKHVSGPTVAEALGAADVSADPEETVARPDVDAVIVASPDFTHAPLSKACIAAGKKVLCEKPLSQSSAECLEVMEAEEKAGTPHVMLGFMRRYDQSYIEMKEALEQGLLGRALMMHNFHRNVETPAAGFTGAMAITNSAPHEFDVVRHVLGTEYTAISAHQPQRSDAVIAPVVMVLETSDAQLITVEVNNNAAYGYDVRAELVGEAGSIAINPVAFTRTDLKLASATRYDADWRGRYAEAYRRQNRDFVEFVPDRYFPGHRRGLLGRLRRRHRCRGRGRGVADRPEDRRHDDIQTRVLRMKLGFVSDSLGAMPFAEMLDHAARMGVSGVEVNTCGWSTAPHLDLAGLLDSGAERDRFRQAFADRGLEIISLNANGNPLHPTDPAQGQGLRDTIRLAGEMGITTVCTMSGLPAGAPGDTMPNWVVSSWPPETQAILRYQWDEKLIPFWTEIAALSREHGVERIALELHGNQCVYNVPSLLKLREVVGPVIGANLDPSHLFWMGADPLVAAEALGEAIYHVHAKDTMLNAQVQATTSLLENGSLMDIPARSWSYITLGFGHGEEWWRRFCYRLQMAGYDGWLSIEHEDVLLNALEGLQKSVALLQGVMPVAPSDFKPQDI